MGNSLFPGLDLMVFDHGVVAGESTSAMNLQEVLRVTADGWIGPQTIGATGNYDPNILIGK
jgi:lysozyme family protein